MDGMQWILGDLALQVKTEYGEKNIVRYAEEIGMGYKTLWRYRQVSETFEKSLRSDYLPWFHYRVASATKNPHEWIRKAIENNWSTRQLQEAILEETQKLEPLPEGSYDIIYADPPWNFTNATDFSPEYNTIKTEELCSFGDKIKERIGVNAILFLWSPNAILPEALEVMKAWGFTYKSNIVWVKPHELMGYWVKSKHEMLLIGKKGDALTPQEGTQPTSILIIENGTPLRHSEKPEEVYAIIERMFPKQNYIELFARKIREGWTSWGNEIEGKNQANIF